MSSLRIWCGVIATFIVGGALVYSSQDSLNRADCKFWNLPRWNEEIRQIEESNEQIGIESTVVLQRISAKDEIVHDLIEGRAKLTEAIERFRELNAGNEELQRALEWRYPDISEDERLYRNILDFVWVEAKDHPDYRTVQARLAYEWEQLQARGSQIQ